MPDAPTNPQAVWTEHTDLREVIEYASAQFENGLTLYIGACRRSDPDAMAVCIKEMRGVVTRLDQFSRTRMRKWNARPKQNLKQEEHKK